MAGNAPEGGGTTYTYDCNGNCIRMVNALSLTTEMEYDKADRLICITQETGAGRISAGCTRDKKQEGYELVCLDGVRYRSKSNKRCISRQNE